MNATAPDAQQLESEKLPSAPFPGGSRADTLRVYIDPTVHAAIHKHASENTTVEICGVLVGAWRRDDMGPYVHVSASIRGDAAASKTAEVTFTHETWAKINQRMDKEFTDKFIVGWYHTHPDFGIFLSDRDVFIHQHFFSAAGQVALVVDPIRGEEGVFTWKSGKPALAAAHWVGTGQRWSPRPSDKPSREVAPAHAPLTATALPPPPPPPPPSILSTAVYAAAAAGLLAIGYFVASFGQQQQHQLTAQALAEQLYNKTSSPVTRKSLVELRTLLSEIGDQSNKLVEPKKEGVESPKLDRINAAINTRLTLAGVELNRAIEANTLTAEQQAAIDWFVAQRLQSTVDQAIKELIARGVLTAAKPTPDPSAKPAPTDPAAPAKPAPPAPSFPSDAAKGTR